MLIERPIMEYKNIDYLFQLSYGYWKSHVLITATDFGIFTLIGEGRLSAGEVAQSIHADERATEMLLNALVSLDLLTVREKRYGNTQTSSLHLIKGRPHYMGNAIRHLNNIMDNWTMLRETVETGKPVSLTNLPEEADASAVRDFITAMHDIASLKTEPMCNSLDLKDARLLLDVAGGPGTYSIALAKANPQLNAVIFDLKQVTPISQEFIRDAGMEGRVTTQAGNCLEDSFGKEVYDAILVSNLLHIYNPENNVKILKKCRDAMKDNGQVIIHEFVLDDTKTRPQFAALFSLNMLIGTQEGASYSETEYRAWLKESGFQHIKRVDLGYDSSIIIGRK
ncbi:MAG: tcmO [Candidatus Brocadiaceae bacterium]|nr:tcmO [Candidatus Brocadiaceae bacterium]